MKQNAIIVSTLALFIALLAPSVVAAQTWVTPNGTVTDWSGNIISQPESVVLLNTHPVFKPRVVTPTTSAVWQASSFNWKLEYSPCAGLPAAVYYHCVQMHDSQE
jgi:hypothetical protein